MSSQRTFGFRCPIQTGSDIRSPGGTTAMRSRLPERYRRCECAAGGYAPELGSAVRAQCWLGQLHAGWCKDIHRRCEVGEHRSSSQVYRFFNLQ